MPTQIEVVLDQSDPIDVGRKSLLLAWLQICWSKIVDPVFEARTVGCYGHGVKFGLVIDFAVFKLTENDVPFLCTGGDLHWMEL